jgi:hypothetical protein
METYTLSLALVDFLPVLFAAIGLYFVIRMVAHINPHQGRVAAVGVLLTVAGGLSKASWKLVMALSQSQVNLTLLDNALFVLMAPGYTLIAWSVWQTSRMVRQQKTFHAWLPPATLIALTFAGSIALYIAYPSSPAWERLLLSVMVLATTVTGVLLIIFAFRQNLPLAGWLLILNLIGVFVLNGMARMEQTIALQWFEQSINAISWLVFWFATSKMYQYVRNNFGIDPVRTAQAVSI